MNTVWLLAGSGSDWNYIVTATEDDLAEMR